MPQPHEGGGDESLEAVMQVVRNCLTVTAHIGGGAACRDQRNKLAWSFGRF